MKLFSMSMAALAATSVLGTNVMAGDIDNVVEQYAAKIADCNTLDIVERQTCYVKLDDETEESATKAAKDLKFAEKKSAEKSASIYGDYPNDKESGWKGVAYKIKMNAARTEALKQLIKALSK